MNDYLHHRIVYHELCDSLDDLMRVLIMFDLVGNPIEEFDFVTSSMYQALYRYVGEYCK